MPRLEHFKPENGDWLPYQTELYRDVPHPWRLSDALERAFQDFEVAARCPEFTGQSKRLVEIFDHACSEREIAGPTWAAFFDKMVTAIVMQSDRFERYLEAYESDALKPDPGRTERTIYDIEEDETGRSVSDSIDVPSDDPQTEEPTLRTRGDTDGKRTRTGTETRVYSSDAMQTGYDYILDWMAKFSTMEEAFIGLFDECFIRRESWRVRY